MEIRFLLIDSNRIYFIISYLLARGDKIDYIDKIEIDNIYLTTILTFFSMMIMSDSFWTPKSQPPNYDRDQHNKDEHDRNPRCKGL